MLYDRYYYSVLNQKEKGVYKLIYKGIEKLDASIEIPMRFCVGVDLADIVQKILLDNPHIFYVDRNGYKTTTTLFNLSIHFNYLYTATEITELRVKINNVVNAMLKRVKETTDYEKEKSVHDLICNNVAYSFETLDNFKKYSAVSNTILGVLFFKTAVCEGIALTVKLLLNMLNIKCIVAFGGLACNYHAWNIVKIGGENYHLDVTNDLSAAGGFIGYDYFNLSDKEISKTHEIIWKYPVCNSTDYNYYIRENLVVHTKNDIERIVRNALSNNQNSVAFKFAGNTSLENARNYAISVLGAKAISFSENKKHNTVIILLTASSHSSSPRVTPLENRLKTSQRPSILIQNDNQQNQRKKWPFYNLWSKIDLWIKEKK